MKRLTELSQLRETRRKVVNKPGACPDDIVRLHFNRQSCRGSAKERKRLAPPRPNGTNLCPHHGWVTCDKTQLNCPLQRYLPEMNPRRVFWDRKCHGDALSQYVRVWPLGLPIYYPHHLHSHPTIKIYTGHRVASLFVGTAGIGLSIPAMAWLLQIATWEAPRGLSMGLYINTA